MPVPSLTPRKSGTCKYFRLECIFSLVMGGKGGQIPPLFTSGHLLVGEDAIWHSMTASSNWGWTWIEVQAPPKRKKSIPSQLRIRTARYGRTTSVERNGVRFAGTHLLVDVLNGTRLDDIGHIERTFRKCIEVSGATLLHIHLHHFTPNGGVSGVAVLSESHISIHSWPEYGYAAIDIFMCGHAKPHLAIDVIRQAFEPDEIIVKEELRGQEAAVQLELAA